MAKFEPTKYLKNLAQPGKAPRYYLETKWRLVWFREDYPEGTITTDVFTLGDMVYVRARVLTDTGVELASGIAGWRVAKSGDTWAGRELEKCETAAIGRALGHAGYGTQFTNDDDVVDGNLADSPVERQKPAPATNGHQANENLTWPHPTLIEQVKSKAMRVFDITVWSDDFLCGKTWSDFESGKAAGKAIEECVTNLRAKEKQPAIVTTAAGEPVDTATGEILTPPVEPDKPPPGYQAAVKRGTGKSPLSGIQAAKTLEDIPVSKVGLDKAPE